MNNGDRIETVIILKDRLGVIEQNRRQDIRRKYNARPLAVLNCHNSIHFNSQCSVS